MTSSKTLYITESAKKDLQSIAKYTQQTWGKKKKKTYLTQLEKAFHELGKNSSLGKRRNDIKEEICSCLVQKHIVFYIETKSELQIVRVLHQRMDVERHIS